MNKIFRARNRSFNLLVKTENKPSLLMYLAYLNTVGMYLIGTIKFVLTKKRAICRKIARILI